ncbi:methyltransferase domain-containing protein [bacterium]|nr:methyltransferase domain-containing protein [bacterium]
MKARSGAIWESYVAGRFDARVDRFPAEIPADDPRLLAVRSCLSDWRGKRLLDLGCGRGRYWPHWKAWGVDVTGIDISRKSLTPGDDRAFRAIGSLARLPWADASFEVVCLLETLQHLPDPAAALREAARVLTPGGAIVIVDRNPLALDPVRPWLPSLMVKWVDERRGLWMYPPDAPVRESWHTPAYWKKVAGDLFGGWRVAYLESSEEPATRIRRSVPLCRPFYALSGTRNGFGRLTKMASRDHR